MNSPAEQRKEPSIYSADEIARIQNIPAEDDLQWRPYAYCLDSDPDKFYAKGKEIQQAVIEEECENCLVISACLGYALLKREPHGIWGGTTEVHRQSLLRRLKRHF